MEETAAAPDPRHHLTLLLPEGADPVNALSGPDADRFCAHWGRLDQLGFELQIRRESLWVRHRGAGFETVIRLSHEDDLGERRALFHLLRGAFGRWSDRFLSWALQASPAVTLPYESLREVLSLCQAVRQRHRVAA